MERIGNVQGARGWYVEPVRPIARVTSRPPFFDFASYMRGRPGGNAEEPHPIVAAREAAFGAAARWSEFEAEVTAKSNGARPPAEVVGRAAEMAEWMSGIEEDCVAGRIDVDEAARLLRARADEYEEKRQTAEWSLRWGRMPSVLRDTASEPDAASV